MSGETERRFVYWIDPADTITHVNDAWVTFALDNGDETLTEAAVVGRSLWEYVSGDEVRHLYEGLFAQVRSGRTIVVPFRCDSPALSRFHEMRMSPLANGEIALECQLLREELRTPRPATVLDPGVPRGEEFIVMCSWCKQVEQPTRDWLELDRAVEEMALFAGSPVPNISHGICPSCKEELKALLSEKNLPGVGTDLPQPAKAAGS